MLRRWSLAAVAAVIVCGVLGVVRVSGAVRNFNYPIAGAISVIVRPFDSQLKVASSDVPAEHLIIDPKQTIYYDVMGRRYHWSSYGHFLIWRDINPPLLAIRFQSTKRDYLSGRAADISEDNNNGLNVLAALHEYPRMCGHYADYGPFRCNESVVRFGRMDRRHSGVESGGYGGDHSDKSKGGSPSGNSCLLVGGDRRCVGGVRRTSLLYQIICLQAVLLFGLLAGYGTTRAIPAGKQVDLRWLAISAASAIIGALFLFGGVTGKVWLFGI